MQQVTLTKGLPGSGKTRWSLAYIRDHPNTVRVSKDGLREMTRGVQKPYDNDYEEQCIRPVRNMLILFYLDKGYDVIVDDCNFNIIHEQTIHALVAGRAEVSIEDFTDVPPEVCELRDKMRPHPVGHDVIWNMYNRYIKQYPGDQT